MNNKIAGMILGPAADYYGIAACVALLYGWIIYGAFIEGNKFIIGV